MRPGAGLGSGSVGGFSWVRGAMMMAEGEGRERRKEGDLVFWLCAYISVLSCEYSTPVHS